MSDSICYWCREPILPHERLSPQNLTAHWECGLRAVAGGINHQRGQCICCGGTEPPDPPDLSRREAANAAAEYFVSHR